MSHHPKDLESLSKRSQSLIQLSQFYSRILNLQLPQNQFSTQHLHQLSLLSQYSIHPVFSSPEIHQFYLKLTSIYWSHFDHIKNPSNLSINTQKIPIIQQLPQQQINLVSQTQSTQENLHIHAQKVIVQEQPPVEAIINTEAIKEQKKQVQQVHIQLKVTKTYRDIKKLFVQFDDAKIDSASPIKSKILLLNSWTSIPCKALNVGVKKPLESPCKIDSATYLENLKLGKNSRKQLPSFDSSKSIILGKNQSTQTKQMKHMLKVQAKTNFVEEKQKQQSKLDDVNKKSIELNYLLNVITKEFFDDFFGDILKILRSNSKTIQVLCEKIVEKVKEEHNFIEIYVDLIKKLTKSTLNSIEQSQNTAKKFNQLQQFLVAYLQEQFIKLIALEVVPSTANFNEYKYQKQITGMCKFIGKLIKQHIMSKKIFKVCFWQIVYRYVDKVKDHPENDIVNECLIQGIVFICDAMGNAELLKLIEKEKECTIIQNDQVAMIERFEEMLNALVNPSDEDHVSREQSYKSLIEEVKVEEYPHILDGLMNIFGSKRMKLQFVIQQWKTKLQVVKATPANELDRLDSNQNLKNEQNQPIEQQSQQGDIAEIRKEINDFISELKVFASKQRDEKTLVEPTIRNNQTAIKQLINSKQSPQMNQKRFKLLTVQFLNQFADCKQLTVVQQRVKYFLGFVKCLGLKDNTNSILLDMICKEEIQNLMIIECDFHYLIDGLCFMMTSLMDKTQTTLEQVQEKMKQSYDPEDEDMTEFCDKLNMKLSKMWSSCQTRKLSEDSLYED